MFFRRIVWSILLVLSMIFAGVVTAQDAESLSYGDTVTGELNAGTPFQEYTFEGTEGDVIVALADTSADREIFSPVIQLFGTGGGGLMESPRGQGGYFAALSFVLNSTGEYTLRVLQPEYSDDTGEFSLTLLQPETLAPGDSIDGQLSIENPNDFYVIENPDGVTVEATLNGAEELVPRFLLRLAQNYRPVSVYTSFSMSVSGTFNVPADEESIYIMVVEYDVSDISIYETARSEYTLTVDEMATADNDVTMR